MKKRVVTLVAFTMLSVSAMFAQNNNGLIGQARGAAHTCLQDYHGNDWRIEATVNDVAICFVSGTIKEVVFTAYHAPSPYARFAPVVIARVQFGCDGNIISTECY